MSTFNALYARHYDLMYAGKTYAEEAAYALRALHESGITTGRLFSVGAGTLNYELLLAKEGFEITGIDLSPSMVELGQQKLDEAGITSIHLAVGDMRSIEGPAEKFDAAVVLFNVISYCSTKEELAQVFSGLAQSVRAGGIVVLDCWNADAVRNSPPESRWKKFSKNETELYRLTEVVAQEGPSVSLSIELLEITDGVLTDRSTEIHAVRGWDRSELHELAANVGLELIHESLFPEWETPVDTTRWALGAVWQKKS